MKIGSLSRSAIVLFLVFPFLFLLTQFRLNIAIDWSEVWWAFKNTFSQAFLSVIFSMILGLAISAGLLRTPEYQFPKFRRFAEFVCILPNLIPTIFIILASLNSISFFPMGIAGTVLIHTIINAGLVAVTCTQIIETKVGRLAQLSYLEGASRLRFFSQVLVPMLYRDFAKIGLFVFVTCFGSFSVPLIVGGGMGTTFEVLIYEKIRLTQDWSAAVYIALIQSIFIFVFSLQLIRGSLRVRAEKVQLYFYGSYWGYLVLLGISLLYLKGYLSGLINGISNFDFFVNLKTEILSNFIGTLFVGLSTGLWTMLLLIVISALGASRWFQVFLNGYVAPSTALASFAILLTSSNMGWVPYFKIPIALVLLGVCGLYRLGLSESLEGLKNQITVAQLMSASSRQIFFQLIWPQVNSKIGYLSGLSAVWACGDFAVSRVLAHRSMTIGMMTDTLMSGYRLNQAILLSTLMIIGGLICFVAVKGVSYVIDRKLEY